MDELGIPRLNGSATNTTFYPVMDNYKDDLYFHREKFKCIDPDVVRLYGDYNSAKANQLALVVRRCVNNTERQDCKSPEEITAWLEDKWVIIYLNE
jgi:hypothetical protein